MIIGTEEAVTNCLASGTIHNEDRREKCQRGEPMIPPPLEFEGTWEEIATHASELAGCRVRLVVLTPESVTASDSNATESPSRSQESGTPEDIFVQQHIQPVATLAAFLASLPDFGSDAEQLWEAILEDRTQRHALVQEVEC